MVSSESNFDRLMGLMDGSADPDHPDNAVVVAELGKPGSGTAQLRDHLQLQSEIILTDPPHELRFDVEHGLAEALTHTRRHMGRTLPQIGHTPRASAEEVTAVLEALRIPPDALRNKAARDAAVKASLANIQAQHGPATRINDIPTFDAVVNEWLEAHVKSVDMLLRGK